MAANVSKISSVALPPDQPKRSQVEVEPEVTGPPAAVSLATADYRLVIEEDPLTRTFIYNTVDRSTGEVVNQFPREELLKLRSDPGYVAGTVVTTRA